MDLLRKTYPLWLREKVYFHFLCNLPIECPIDGVSLQFAPARIRALLPTDYGHRQIIKLGYYERKLSANIADWARRGGVLVDVGANIGYYTIIWLALNPENRVYAFEPSTRNLSMLRENLSSLCNSQRGQLFEFALGAEECVSDFDVGPPQQSGWGGISLSRSDVKVKVKRLDDVIPSNVNIDVLKIDTEGADTWVIQGAERLLSEKRIKCVYFESNPTRMDALGISAGEAESFLGKLDYSVQQLEPGLFEAAPR